MKIIRPADWRITPWRSGQGETAEIAVFPGDSDLRSAAFDWRVSLATMGEDADFSPFPGFDRILTVVAGDGLWLDNRPDGPCIEASPLSPVAFPGEGKVTGRLMESPVKNLNLMTERQRVDGVVTVLSLAEPPPPLKGEASGLLLFAPGPEPLFIKDRIGDACYQIGAREALLQCNATDVAFELEVQGEAEGKLVLVQISRLRT